MRNRDQSWEEIELRSIRAQAKKTDLFELEIDLSTEEDDWFLRRLEILDPPLRFRSYFHQRPF